MEHQPHALFFFPLVILYLIFACKRVVWQLWLKKARFAIREKVKERTTQQQETPSKGDQRTKHAETESAQACLLAFKFQVIGRKKGIGEKTNKQNQNK